MYCIAIKCLKLENYCQLSSPTSWVLIQITLCNQKINRLSETILKNKFSKIGKGKQLTWINLQWFGWLHLSHVAIKAFETMKLKNKQHQRLQFQHAPENTWVPGEGFTCEKLSNSDTP